MKAKRNGSVHSETFEMQRHIWRKDAEMNKHAHLKDCTIFGVFFLIYFETITFQDICNMNPVDVLYHASNQDLQH